MGAWLGGGEETNVVNLGVFFLNLQNVFSPKWEENEGESLICLIDKNAHMHLHMSFIQFLSLSLFFSFPSNKRFFFFFFLLFS